MRNYCTDCKSLNDCKRVLKPIAILFLIISLLISMISVCAVKANADVVAYSQYDNRWRGWVYGGGNIGDTGCGILSTTNAINYLCGLNDVGGFIDELATWAHNRGAFNPGSSDDGTYRLDLYPYLEDAFGAKYGFKVDEGSIWGNARSETLKNHLANGGVSVAHVAGHFICLAGYNSNENTFLVLDSAPSYNRGTPYGVAWLSEADLTGNYSQMIVDWFCLISAANVVPVKPYIIEGEYYLNDCDSQKGWRTAYNTGLALGESTYPPGYYMVMNANDWQANNDPCIGAMAFYEYTDGYEADLTGYDTIYFDLYSSVDYRNAGRDSDYFQINFFTSGEDGYNLTIPASQIASDWHSYAIKKSAIAAAVPSADWSSIAGIRFTWFNMSHGENVTFAIDTVKAYNSALKETSAIDVPDTVTMKNDGSFSFDMSYSGCRSFDTWFGIYPESQTSFNAESTFGVWGFFANGGYQSSVSSSNGIPTSGVINVSTDNILSEQYGNNGTFTNGNTYRVVMFYNDTDRGYEVIASDTFTLIAETPEIKEGDADNNGVISSLDALMTLQQAVFKINLPSDIAKACDVDGDGFVTAIDALMILQFSVGKITEFTKVI